MDSPKRAPGALSAFEGNARGASREACASLEDEAPAEEPPLNDKVTNEALPTEEAGGPPPQARRPSLTLSRARRTRPLDKLILGSYVKLLEWSRPPMDTPTPDQEAACLLVRKCNPFYKRESSIANMCNLYPHSLRVPMVTRFEEYTQSPSLTTWIRGLISLRRKTRCISAIMTSMRWLSWYGPTSNV